jgi:hypothetical protein
MYRDIGTPKRLDQSVVLMLRQDDVGGGKHLCLSRIRHFQLLTRTMEEYSLKGRPLVGHAARSPDRAYLVTE